MKVKPMKPLIAAGAAGALLAAGGLAAFELGTSDAQAQNGSSLASQVAKNTQGIAANQKRVVADLKRVCQVWNGGGYWPSDAGTKPPPASAPKCVSKTAVGSGYPATDLDDPWWAKNYYNGATNTYTGKGLTSITRLGVGEYMVNWQKDISQCAYTVTPGYYNGGSPDKYAIAQVYNGTAPNNVIVKTYKTGAAVVATDYPWQAEVTCHPPTMTSP